jgi:hypothetical protein
MIYIYAQGIIAYTYQAQASAHNTFMILLSKQNHGIFMHYASLHKNYQDQAWEH